MKSKFLILLCAMAVLLGTVGAANAGTVTYTASKALATTNWSSNLSVPLYDPASFGGQPLLSVVFGLTGSVLGDAKFESLDAAPATITMFLQAVITLMRPDTTMITQVLPLVSTSDNVTAFDGNIDFGGTSGKTYLNISSSLFSSLSSPPPLSDLALFTGIGNILLPITATGISYATGAGNLITQFNTKADAGLTVTYTYSDVPVPAAVWLFGSGLVGLIGVRRRFAR
jgi:uncharacterized membrane protein YeaQ/YmgE (transglycosylase-associated protein family)